MRRGGTRDPVWCRSATRFWVFSSILVESETKKTDNTDKENCTIKTYISYNITFSHRDEKDCFSNRDSGSSSLSTSEDILQSGPESLLSLF